MRKKPNPKLVGGFVLGALAIVVAGVLIFGSVRFFAKKLTYVLYFDGSVKGLSIGSPVLLKGVEIGTVNDIKVHFNAEDLSIRTPVFVDIEPDRVSEISGVSVSAMALEGSGTQEIVNQLVLRGLRARLELASFVTGRLVIAFDFHPNTPVHLVGLDKERPELPTIASGMEELSRSIEKLPLEQLFNKAVRAVDGFDRLVNSPDLHASISSLNRTLRDSGKLARNLDRRLEPTATNLEETLTDTRKLLKNVDGKVTQVTSSLERTLKSTDAAAVQIEKTFGAVADVVGKNGSLIYQLTDMLSEVTATARSIRNLTDYLERHPESVLAGKTGS
jgi:paraquat-inducible protein B